MNDARAKESKEVDIDEWTKSTSRMPGSMACSLDLVSSSSSICGY